jgi:hypothetical protein
MKFHQNHWKELNLWIRDFVGVSNCN